MSNVKLFFMSLALNHSFGLLDRVPALNFQTLGAVVKAERVDSANWTEAMRANPAIAARLRVKIVFNNKLELTTRAVY